MEAKYIVRVNILKSDVNGEFSSENFEYVFNEPTMIKSRNLAIAKTKKIIYSFENEMPDGEQFSCPLVAQLKGFKDFKAYSIELIFLPKEEFDYIIYGEEDLVIEALEQEAYYYRDGSDNHKFMEVENEDGEIVEILKSNHKFFLGY